MPSTHVSALRAKARTAESCAKTAAALQQKTGHYFQNVKARPVLPKYLCGLF